MIREFKLVGSGDSTPSIRVFVDLSAYIFAFMCSYLIYLVIRNNLVSFLAFLTQFSCQLFQPRKRNITMIQYKSHRRFVLCPFLWFTYLLFQSRFHPPPVTYSVEVSGMYMNHLHGKLVWNCNLLTQLFFLNNLF